MFCRFFDFIKGSKSIVFFIKLFSISWFVISNPFGLKTDFNI